MTGRLFLLGEESTQNAKNWLARSISGFVIQIDKIPTLAVGKGSASICLQ